jgi:hypothetical protein
VRAVAARDLLAADGAEALAAAMTRLLAGARLTLAPRRAPPRLDDILEAGSRMIAV